MTSKRTSRWLLMGIAAAVLSAGCAHTVTVAPKPVEKVTTEKIPLDIGLYLAKELKAYRVSEFRKGDKWNYDNLGEASAVAFRLGLGEIFRTVEVVDERPPFAKPKSRAFHAVIEPTIEKFEFEIPMTKFQVYPARIQYRITVFDLDGKLVFTKIVEGIGDTKGSPGFDFTENPAKSASKAIEEGARLALEAVLASDDIKALVRQ